MNSTITRKIVEERLREPEEIMNIMVKIHPFGMAEVNFRFDEEIGDVVSRRCKSELDETNESINRLLDAINSGIGEDIKERKKANDIEEKSIEDDGLKEALDEAIDFIKSIMKEEIDF